MSQGPSRERLLGRPEGAFIWKPTVTFATRCASENPCLHPRNWISQFWKKSHNSGWQNVYEIRWKWKSRHLKSRNWSMGEKPGRPWVVKIYMKRFHWQRSQKRQSLDCNLQRDQSSSIEQRNGKNCQLLSAPQMGSCVHKTHPWVQMCFLRLTNKAFKETGIFAAFSRWMMMVNMAMVNMTMMMMLMMVRMMIMVQKVFGG